MLTFGRSPSPILPSIFPFFAETTVGKSGSSSLQPAAGGAARFQYQSHTSIVIFPVMFVGVQFFIYFSFRKAGKPIWKKYFSHVISNYLAVVPGTGLLTVSRRRVGETQLQPQEERGREILIWLWLHLPSLLFPFVFLFLREPQLLLHTINSPHSPQDCQCLACAAFCPFSSTHSV